ncbi:cytochrome P450 3A16 [Galendromus occidentalis]|uniref:Cytochrome P450 3A16 n=1 Tax=Galendromus occidentalis TaxID=34638 RepID=A0AAJ6VZ39_9ACAR|nr:cytochrome P450 3A16 [Galendromus occidentalis]
MFTAALFFVFVALIVKFLQQRWIRFQYFKRMGIPGPQPHFLWGHYRELRENHVLWEERWKAQYGKTFGVFWGDKPFLITSDPVMAKQVLVRQFSNFVNRAEQFALERAHPIVQHVVALEKDEHWKRTRLLLSPAFSVAKMKNMISMIEKCVDEFESNLRKRASGKQFDVYPLIKRLSIDNICGIIFGIETKLQENPEEDSVFLRATLKVFEADPHGLLDLICNSFTSVNNFLSSILYLLQYLRIVPHVLNDMIDEVENIVKARRKSPPRKDLMQSLLDHQQISSDGAPLKATDAAEDQKASFGKTISARLTNEEVVASAIVMFAAGYETTGTATAFTFKCLGSHPDIQRRLRREINDATRGKPLSYDTVMSLPYLDAVIRESLRLYPPLTNMIHRVASQDTEINGLKIPAGLSILFPTKVMHSDEDFWEDPNRFDPERFLKKNYDAFTYQPFGDGPRNCLGMRFALLTMKLTLCKILPKFEVVATEEPVVEVVRIVCRPAQLNISVEEIAP